MKFKATAILFLFVPIFLHAQENPDKQNALTYYNIALTSDQMGNYERAISYFEQAYALDSSYKDVYSQIGNVYCKMLLHSKAIPYFQKDINLNPKNTDSYMNLANTYYFLGKYEEAVTYYTKTINIDSNHVKAYRNMGNAYYSLKNTEKYLENYKKAARLGDFEIQLWLRTNDESW